MPLHLRHAQPTDVIERALGFAAVMAMGGTAAGAYLTHYGFGPQTLACIVFVILLISALSGLWALHQASALHRGELARVYATALQGQRDRALEQRASQPTRLESLGQCMAAIVESARLAMLRGNGLVRWATDMRADLDKRGRDALRLAGSMDEDARLIREAAAGSRQAEGALTEGLGKIQTRAGAALAATEAVTQEANALADAIRSVTNRTEQGTTIAMRLSETAFATQRTMAGMADSTAALLRAADQVQHILKRAEMLSVNAGIEAARAGEQGRGFAIVATEIKTLAGTGNAALGSMLTTLHEMKAHSAQVQQRVQDMADVVQSQHEFGHALAHAAMLQSDAVGRLISGLSTAHGEVRALRAEAADTKMPDTRLGAGAAAQQAVERLPGYAEAMAQILRGLPDFAPGEKNWERAE